MTQLEVLNVNHQTRLSQGPGGPKVPCALLSCEAPPRCDNRLHRLSGIQLPLCPPCLKPGRARLSFRQAGGICTSDLATLAGQGWRDARTRLWRYFYFFLFCQLNEEPREHFAERWEWTLRVCLGVCSQCRAEKCQCSCRHKSQGDSLDEFQCNNLTLPYCSPAFIPALVSKLCWLR